MRTIGYVRVSTDGQAEQGVALEAQEAKIRAMATVQGSELLDVMVDGGESAKSLNRPGLQRLLALINAGKVEAVIVAKLDRLTRSVKDLCGLLELFEKRKVALISVAESLDTGSAAGRLVITIMAAGLAGALLFLWFWWNSFSQATRTPGRVSGPAPQIVYLLSC